MGGFPATCDLEQHLDMQLNIVKFQHLHLSPDMVKVFDMPNYTDMISLPLRV